MPDDTIYIDNMFTNSDSMLVTAYRWHKSTFQESLVEKKKEYCIGKDIEIIRECIFIVMESIFFEYNPATADSMCLWKF